MAPSGVNKSIQKYINNAVVFKFQGYRTVKNIVCKKYINKVWYFSTKKRNTNENKISSAKH